MKANRRLSWITILVGLALAITPWVLRFTSTTWPWST
jgi:hypothetical protein